MVLGGGNGLDICTSGSIATLGIYDVVIGGW